MENRAGFPDRGENPLTPTQELAKRAKIALSSIITDRLPGTEEELDRLTSPEKRAGLKLDFLGQVAGNDTIRKYLRRTGREFEIVNFTLLILRGRSYFDLLLNFEFDRIFTGNLSRDIDVALIIGPQGLEIKGFRLSVLINSEESSTTFLRREPEAVRAIAEKLDLSRCLSGCLSKIEAAIQYKQYNIT